MTKRTLLVRPDTIDFRDRIYQPTLVQVPAQISLEAYKSVSVPILDQGQEGACTGFALATVANYLLRIRQPNEHLNRVSPRMLYEMAKRYDEWPGEEYSGSSARGAVKGWYKHGVCRDEMWPYRPAVEDTLLSRERAEDATQNPLGAYLRVNHKDLIAMHSALAEVGILFATANVHEGWNDLESDGSIPFRDGSIGGHAFAIVAYNDIGFWIQNSWGESWGEKGFALLTYDDWLINGHDIWVTRLGAPIKLTKPAAVAASQFGSTSKSESFTFQDLQPHIISIGNDGRLRSGGTYGTSEEEVREIFTTYFPSITRDWSKKRIVLYAHGGLVDEKSAIQLVADYRKTLLDNEVYPISLIWKSDALTTIGNILKDAFRNRRSEGFLDDAKDFMLDRVDDTLEPLVRGPGKSLWDEMKENAAFATLKQDGGVRLTLDLLAKVLKADPSIEVHVIGHSAGAILHAPLVRYLTSSGRISSGLLKGQKGLGQVIESCTLWAPACTVELFKQEYVPALESNSLKGINLFTLTDQAEQDDDVLKIYNKSILYLVSNAFEDPARIPLIRDGKPILGMVKFIEQDSDLQEYFSVNDNWIIAPNTNADSENASTSETHGSFDNDDATLKATLARITSHNITGAQVDFHRSKTELQENRKQLE